MKYLIIAMLAFATPSIVFCQDITGLWTGTMVNDLTQQSLPYEIFISKHNGKYTGYSQTFVSIEGKEYHGIKKINVRIAKDGKIIIQDASLIETNFPEISNKNVIQLNVLDIKNQDNVTNMDGLFVTNRSKLYKELTGRISLKRASASTDNSLVKYINKNSNENEIAVVK